MPKHKRPFEVSWPVSGLQYSYLRLPLAPRPATPAPSIGVFIHAYYETEIESILPWLEHIGAPHTLFVSTDTAEKKAFLEAALRPRYGEAAIVRVFDNRGRDVAPKYVGFRDELLSCDLVLHLHTKKSLHDSKLAGWREFMLGSLLGSREICDSILALFNEHPNLGVIAPRVFPDVQPAMQWTKNYCRTVYLARRMGVTLEGATQIDFPAGSMFWARSAALRPIVDLDLGFGSFEPESGQVDGTTAHAIERLIFYAAERAGYRALHVGADSETEPFETLIAPEALEQGWARLR